MTSEPRNPADGPGGDGEPVIERIERNPAGRLVVHLAGRAEPIVDARLARCFPWSFPDAYISVRTADGKEIALLDSLDALDGPSRSIAAEELHDKVFNPKIQRVVDFKMEFGVASITAETDRGQIRFQIRTRDDVRMLSPTRALFRDPDGNTYEIEDVNALDEAGRKHLRPYF